MAIAVAICGAVKQVLRMWPVSTDVYDLVSPLGAKEVGL